MRQISPIRLSETGLLFWMLNVLITIVTIHFVQSEKVMLSGYQLNWLATMLFDHFIKAEWLIALVVFLAFFIYNEAGEIPKRIYAIAILIVMCQAAWLLPAINGYTSQQIDSVSLFAILETVKIILLSLAAIILLERKTREPR